MEALCNFSSLFPFFTDHYVSFYTAAHKNPIIGQSGSAAISNFHLDSDFIPVLCHDICYKDFPVQEPVKPAALCDKEVEISNTLVK